MSGPAFKAGDRVTFTNDQGCVFPCKTILGVDPQPFDGKIRYFITPTDSPWFSFAEHNLTPEQP